MWPSTSASGLYHAEPPLRLAWACGVVGCPIALPTRPASRRSCCRCCRLTVTSALLFAPLHRCWPYSRSPLSRAHGHARHRLAIYGATPRGPWPVEDARACPLRLRACLPDHVEHVPPRQGHAMPPTGLSLSLLPPSESRPTQLTSKWSSPFNSARLCLRHQVLLLPNPTPP